MLAQPRRQPGLERRDRRLVRDIARRVERGAQVGMDGVGEIEQPLQEGRAGLWLYSGTAEFDDFKIEP